MYKDKEKTKSNSFLQKELENREKGKVCMVRQHCIGGWYIAFYLQKDNKAYYIDRYLDLFIYYGEDIKYCISGWLVGFKMEIQNKLT